MLITDHAVVILGNCCDTAPIELNWVKIPKKLTCLSKSVSPGFYKRTWKPKVWILLQTDPHCPMERSAKCFVTFNNRGNGTWWYFASILTWGASHKERSFSWNAQYCSAPATQPPVQVFKEGRTKWLSKILNFWMRQLSENILQGGFKHDSLRCWIFNGFWRQISLLGAFPSFQQNCPFTLPRKPLVRSYNSQKISSMIKKSNLYSVCSWSVLYLLPMIIVHSFQI